MSNYNKTILMGRLVKDPEIRYTQGGTAVVSFTLAVNHRFKAANGAYEEKASFIDCTMFGKRGEAFEKHHRKGSSAFIDGRIEQQSWDDKNTGQKRSKLVIIADSFEFVGGGEKQQGGQQSQSAGSRDFGFGSEPAGAGDFLGVDEDTPF